MRYNVRLWWAAARRHGGGPVHFGRGQLQHRRRARRVPHGCGEGRQELRLGAAAHHLWARRGHDPVVALEQLHRPPLVQEVAVAPPAHLENDDERESRGPTCAELNTEKGVRYVSFDVWRRNVDYRQIIEC